MKKLLLLPLLFISFISFSQVPNYVPTDSLVGWWGFNGNANDESGNGNDGTVNGATLTTDRFGTTNTAYDFDGLTDEITVSESTNMDGFYEFTLSCWINLDNVTTGGGGGAGLVPIISKWGPSALWPESSYILSLQDDFVAYGIDCSSNTANYGLYQVQSINSFQVQTWYHILAQNTLEDFKLFINGNLVGVTSQINEGISDNNTLLRFGSWWANVNSSYSNLDGRIDDIGIWNRALDSCEIIDLYNAELSCATSINELDNSLVNLFPNPSNDIITLTLAQHSNGQIILTDILGKELLSKSFTSNAVQINLKSLTSKGTYFAKVLDSAGNVIAIKKLIYQ
jgi:hypothetical protein